jgi:RimJ/RimL family protein N-acetyltransferase
MADDRTLTTERLTMSPHGLDDFAEFSAMWCEPQIVRYFGVGPFADEDNWQRLMRYAGNWALLGCGFWAVRRRDTGLYLGDVGFFDGHRTGVAGFDGSPEIGWSLAGAAQGQGFATEAVRAALGWGAGRFNRTVAMIHPDNSPSLAVATRCGFAPFALAEYRDAPVELWDYRWG